MLGVSGSIAAYKSALLVRLLIKEGAEVKVVLTPSALEFVTPLTLSTLSQNPVHSDFTEDKDTGEWVSHVDLGNWGDLLVIAPCTANTMGKMVGGICDNFLMAVYLSANCPVMIAPAMDLDMYKHFSTSENIKKLIERGHLMAEPGTGELASGLEGKGRMSEPEEILELIEEYFSKGQDLNGKRALVTAGPTHEKIDPVRYISNYSSGKMGFALANELRRRGAEVTLVTGPSQQVLEETSINRIDVVSADDMLQACIALAPKNDIIIMSAAVADYRPKTIASEKIKKADSENSLDLEPTVDILAKIGETKKKEQILIGFALETENEIINAKAKIEAKNLDMIVLNSLKDKGAGFAHDTNKVTLLQPNNKMISFELKSKPEVATDIVNNIIDLIRK